jgi:hypothetical protein
LPLLELKFLPGLVLPEPDPWLLLPLLELALCVEPPLELRVLPELELWLPPELKLWLLPELKLWLPPELELCEE